MQIPSDVFKAYDIRTIYAKGETEELAYRVGRSLVYQQNTDTVVVGRDSRVTSPDLASCACRGACAAGARVFNAGLVSTDQFYYICNSRRVPGIMVTASHNPAEYNGFNLVSSDGSTIGQGSGMEDIEDGVRMCAASDGDGSKEVTDIDTLEEFLDRLSSIVPPETVAKAELVVDAGNGTLGPLLSSLKDRYTALNIRELYWEPDGTFPNRGPDPLKDKNREVLKEEVIKGEQRIGVSFDADGDRVFVLDERGRFIQPDIIGSLLSEFFLLREPGEGVVHDITVSRILSETVGRCGGTSYAERVGHTYIKQRMKKENAVFGVERSGHFYFRDFYYADSGVLAMLFLLSVLAEKGRSLAECVDPYMGVYHVTDPMSFPVKEDLHDVLDRLADTFSDGTVSRRDGVAVDYETWRFVVRPSNTEPVVRVVVEATTPDILKERTAELERVITRS